MANAQNAVEEALSRIAEALGGPEGRSPLSAAPAGPQAAGDSVAAFTEAAEQLRLTEQVQASLVSENTEAVTKSAQSGSGGSIGGAVTGLLESAFPLVPLISGLASLFGGGGDSEVPPPLSVYTAPESIRFEGDVYRNANHIDWAGSEGAASGAPLTASTQITVQVNALDSQSFLDHSQDIARAVRQAMLNSNSLNDVVSEL